jgi:hypothetical protein
MEKLYSVVLPARTVMSDYPLEAILRDQELFVGELFEQDSVLRKYQKPSEGELNGALRRQSVQGIRDGLDAFMNEEKRAGRDAGKNIFDYDIGRFIEKGDLKTPVAKRIADDAAVRAGHTKEFRLGLFETVVETIAHTVSEAYRAHMLHLYLGEVTPRASQSGTKESSE